MGSKPGGGHDIDIRKDKRFWYLSHWFSEVILASLHCIYWDIYVGYIGFSGLLTLVHVGRRKFCNGWYRRTSRKQSLEQPFRCLIDIDIGSNACFDTVWQPTPVKKGLKSIRYNHSHNQGYMILVLAWLILKGFCKQPASFCKYGRSAAPLIRGHNVWWGCG